jgi:hypothetical protein
MRALALMLPILLLTPGTAHAWRCSKTSKGPPVRAALLEPYAAS